MLQRVEGRSVLAMPRDDWDALQTELGKPVVIDVRETPMAGVADSVVRATAEELSTAAAEVEIMRYDANDVAKGYPYNVDTYSVLTNVLNLPGLESIVSRASTTIDDNFRAFAAQNVLLVKQDADPDHHWLPTIPGSSSTIVRST